MSTGSFGLNGPPLEQLRSIAAGARRSIDAPETPAGLVPLVYAHGRLVDGQIEILDKHNLCSMELGGEGLRVAFEQELGADTYAACAMLSDGERLEALAPTETRRGGCFLEFTGPPPSSGEVVIIIMGNEPPGSMPAATAWTGRRAEA